MKKLLLYSIVLLATLVSAGTLNAQVSAYSFAESTEVYASITGTTSTALGDDGTQTAIPIGFTFTFGVTNYTTFSITTNGMIRLGGAVISSGWTNSLGNTATLRPLIATFWDDNDLNTGGTAGSIVYSTTGTSPNRILTVNVINTHVGGSGSTSGPQVSTLTRLYETTNVIEMVYSSPFTTTNTVTASVGLNDMTSFLSVTPAATSSVSSATANNSINATVMANLAGKKLTFTPPPCLAPSAISVSGITTSGASINFTSASNSIIEYSTTSGFTAGTGASAGSGSSSVSASGASPMALTGLTANTTYYYVVRQDCTGSSNGYSSNSSQQSFYTGYCTPAPSSVDAQGITNVQAIGTISNAPASGAEADT